MTVHLVMILHSLVSSGTTPKLLARESHIRVVGYGAFGFY